MAALSQRARAWGGDPWWATALPSMSPAGQRFARGIWSLIGRSDARRLWCGSGYRTSSTEHILRRALDIICTERTGIRARTHDTAGWAEMETLVALLVRYAAQLRIRHIIWDRRIYRTRYGAWGPLPGRDEDSSVSDWHEDHAHVLLEADSPGWLPILDTLTLGGAPARPTTPTTPSPEEDDIMAMTPAERAQLVAEIADASRAAVVGQLMTGPGINPDTKPTLHDFLVQLPQRTSSAVHGQWLGSSGPAIGTAVQGTNHGVQALAVRVEALIALLEQAGPSADVATMQRIADEAVTDYAQRLAAAVETA